MSKGYWESIKEYIVDEETIKERIEVIDRYKDVLNIRKHTLKTIMDINKYYRERRMKGLITTDPRSMLKENLPVTSEKDLNLIIDMQANINKIEDCIDTIDVRMDFISQQVNDYRDYVGNTIDKEEID